MSISKDPLFRRNSIEPVFYLCHPVAGDKDYSYEANMEHIPQIMKFFWRECKLRVVAPYHTILLALDDTNDEERRCGLECDLTIVRQMNRVILVGHKISSGMTDELHAAVCGTGVVWNFVGLNRRAILETKEVRDHLAAYAVRKLNIELDGNAFNYDRGQAIGVGSGVERRCNHCGKYSL